MNCIDEELVIEVASQRDNLLRSEQLVTAAQSGSSAAFAELREIYSQRIFRQLLTITKNREDAEDAMQDAFLRAYMAMHTFEGRSSFYSWLTRIAINSGLMLLRKRRGRPEVSYDHPSGTEEEATCFDFKHPGPSPEQICARRQRCVHVLRSIGKLQPRLRQVLEMQLTQSYSVKEIAQALEISEAAVKSRLFRARLRLASTRSFRDLETAPHASKAPLSNERAA